MSYLLSKVALIGAAFAAGGLLRSTGLFTKEDAKAASLFITYGTLPSLALQTFLLYGFLWWEGPAMATAAVLASSFYCLLTWSLLSGRRSAERSLFAASAASVSAGSIALGFVEAVFGAVGLHMALLWDLGNSIANSSISYFILAKGGRSGPEQYIHMDGGVYRGSWRGGKKEGLGTYTYPSGARYQGQWENNLKHGLGVYYFPKGGWYEGEWRHGDRSGSGVRVKSSGRTQAGIWQGLELVEERSPEEYVFVITAARDTAAAAKRGVLGIVLQLTSQPLLWAALVSAVATASGYQIPAAVDFVTAYLASAHIPLAVLVFGLQTDLDMPAAKQARDFAVSMAVRFSAPLLLGTAAAAVLSQRYTDAVAIAAICSCGPISEQVAYYVQLFQLNEVLASRALSCSRIISIAVLFAATVSLMIVTPPEQALTRSGLALTLALVASVLGVAGSVAFQLLASSRPARSQTGLKPGEVPTAAAGRLMEEPIPIGIAWRDQGGEAAQAQAMQDSEGKASGGSSMATNVDQAKVESGADGQGGEASAVSSWDQAGSVLADAENSGNARENPREKLDLGSADFQLGGRFPDIGAAQTSSKNVKEQAGPSQERTSDSRRRRGRRRDPHRPEGLSSHCSSMRCIHRTSLCLPNNRHSPLPFHASHQPQRVQTLHSPHVR